ncbi:MAG: cobalamin biosynthesis protein, partial [Rhodoferax sp.]
MPGIFTLLGALLVALAVDRWWGEPPMRWHPVVWMGNALERCAPWVLPPSGGAAPDVRDWKAFGRGALAWGV